MKQVTLSSAWQPKKPASVAHLPRPQEKPPDEEILIDSDDEDQILVQAMDDTLAALKTDEQPAGQPSLEDLPGFDTTAGRTWIYPINYPVRDYQFNIVQTCLYQNTLVILPTGLGKTFIAAVVMYNFYRWYPRGKVIFTAPTKPLVAQQVEACFNIMGIPLDDTIEMTGTIPASQRKKAWQEKRVFFLTPQVMANDLLRGACPPEDVKCLVIDEAHKALGQYAYCQIVKELLKYTSQFRVLALSATPGSDVTAVQQVLSNLMISRVELRTEESLDIQKYTQHRTIEKVVVPLGEEMEAIKEKFLAVTCTYLQRLTSHGAIRPVDPESLGKFRILLMKDEFQANPPAGLAPHLLSQLHADFGLLISLYHAYELLLGHGLRSFFGFLKGIMDGDKSQPRARFELMQNSAFRELFSELEEKLGGSANLDDTLNVTATGTQLFEKSLASKEVDDRPYVMSHPKLAKLDEIVLEHFQKFQNEGNNTGQESTRVMVFSQYRDSVKEITTLLNRHRPLIKAMNFVGQKCSSGKGFTQKQQIMVVKKFREGGYNTLVSTCVGEEGLDIGEIDLIVCYDAPKSPIRLVQRMGRTGRKRQGRIVILVTQGREERAYKQSNSRKQSIHKAILSGAQFKNLYDKSPRMVPKGLNPVCHRMHMTVAKYHSTNTVGNAAGATSAEAAVGRGQRKITKMLATRGAGKQAAHLTAKEKLYYEAHFEVPPRCIPRVPKVSQKFVTLCSDQSNASEKHGTSASTEDEARPELSLSNWTVWQDSLQPTFGVPHSRRTKAFVKVMQFIDRLRQVPSEIETYDFTMSTYLRKEDIADIDSQVSDVESVAPNPSVNGSPGEPRKKAKAVKKPGKKQAKNAKAKAQAMDAVAKPTRKRRMITDFFQDVNDFEAQSADVVGPVAGDEHEVVELSGGSECRSPLRETAAKSETLETLFCISPGPESSDKSEGLVDVRTPPPLDKDVFPCGGRPAPVDVRLIVTPEKLGEAVEEGAIEHSTPKEKVNTAAMSETSSEPLWDSEDFQDIADWTGDLFFSEGCKSRSREGAVRAEQTSANAAELHSTEHKLSLQGTPESQLRSHRSTTRKNTVLPSHSTPIALKQPRSSPSSEAQDLEFPPIREAPCPEKDVSFDDSNCELFQNISVLQSPQQQDEGERFNTTEFCDILNHSSTSRTKDASTSLKASRPDFDLEVDLGSWEFEDDVEEVPDVTTKKRESPEKTSLRAPHASTKNVPVALVRPLVQNNASPVKIILSSDDDSPVRQCRKKTGRAVLISSSENEGSPPRKTKLQQGQQGESMTVSDDDFQDVQPSRNLRKKRSKTKSQPGKQKRKRNACPFVESEADVSSDAPISGDESENSSLDVLDESFIDDEEEALTQMQAVYMRTTKSPIRPGQFKIGYRSAPPPEIFSQAVSPDVSDYLLDSFCVQGDDQEASRRDTSSSSADEKVLTSRHRKRKQKPCKPKARRRILTPLEEEATEENAGTSVSPRVPYRIKPTLTERGAPSKAGVTKQAPTALNKASSPAVGTSATGQTTFALSREERLRLQKLKQEEFRKKFQEQQKQKASATQKWIVTSHECSSSSGSGGADRQVSLQADMMVIMDTKAITACPTLVSALRRQPGVCLEVRSLPAGDFQLSHRTGGARWAIADLANTQGHRDLVEEVRRLYSLYDRPCIILESDPSPEARPFKRTKHFYITLLQLASTHAKLLVSHSQENTADLLAAVAKQEHRKGMAIPVLSNLKDIERVVPFYMALPRVNLGVAMSLAAGYRSIDKFLHSSPEEIQRIGKVPENRAKEIFDFCNKPCPF